MALELTEATPNLALADVSQQVRALVIDGKPLPLARQIMGATNDAERIDLLTGAVHVCSQALTTKAITPTKANLRMRQIGALDGSEDNANLLKALQKLEESSPAECQAVICSLSVATVLNLAQPDTGLGAFIVENCTPKRLASVANTIAGTVYISDRHLKEKRGNFSEEDAPIRHISNDPEIKHSRQKAVRRRLGKFLDLVVEAGEESLGEFALAITSYQHEPDEPSILFDTICRLALEDGRESAIDVINALPETPKITAIKIKLGLKDE